MNQEKALAVMKEVNILLDREKLSIDEILAVCCSIGGGTFAYAIHYEEDADEISAMFERVITYVVGFYTDAVNARLKQISPDIPPITLHKRALPTNSMPVTEIGHC